MSQEPRYEIVLLEDELETLRLLEEELGCRSITVHAFTEGEGALQRIIEDPHIGALLTDIEIRDANGMLCGLQGYDVANSILSDAPNRLLSVIVMTRLSAKLAFRNLDFFAVPVLQFHKDEWIDAKGPVERTAAFDRLASLLKEAVERTPHRFREEIERENPKSRWVRDESNYWSIYRKLWFSRDWAKEEREISRRATEIVGAYLGQGESKKLKGEVLSFASSPTPSQFLSHLVGRRLIYALRALEPAYWEQLIGGEVVEEEKTAVDADVWRFASEKVKALTNYLQRYSADNGLSRKHEMYERLSRADQERYLEAKKDAQPKVIELAQALEREPEEVRRAFIPYLRFWDLNFTKVDWTTAPGVSDTANLRQTLLLLGVRKEDISDSDSKNWRFLLPEERKWLREVIAEHA